MGKLVVEYSIFNEFAKWRDPQCGELSLLHAIALIILAHCKCKG